MTIFIRNNFIIIYLFNKLILIINISINRQIKKINQNLLNFRYRLIIPQIIQDRKSEEILYDIWYNITMIIKTSEIFVALILILFNIQISNNLSYKVGNPVNTKIQTG